MKIQIRNITLILVAILVAFAMASLLPTYRVLTDAIEYATDSYAIEHADVLTAQARASWTSTITLSPTLTLVPSRTPTLTLSPTATLTPTVAPCISSTKDKILSPTLYGQPSMADTPQNFNLDRGSDIRLYYKLDDEPWWRASRYGVNTPEGWVYEPDLLLSCDKLPVVSLKYLAENNLAKPLLEESFSKISDDWLDLNGKRITLIPSNEDGYSQLWLDTIVKGAASLEIFSLQQPRLPEHWKLWTSLQRISLSGGSYIGFRIYPSNKENTYIEIRFYREKCGYEYSQSVDGQVEQGVVASVYSGCVNDAQTFITMEGRFDRIKSQFILTPTYNGRKLLPREFADPQHLFSSGKFSVISSGIEGVVDYLLLMDLPN